MATLPERMPVFAEPYEPGVMIEGDGEPVYGDVYQGPVFPNAYLEPFGPEGPWTLQMVPDGLIYRSYLAGVKEPRMAGVVGRGVNQGYFLDSTLGGRVGLLRYGTLDDLHPQGWQVDLEGAAFPRIDLETDWDLQSSDFRVGIPLTYGIGRYQMKIAFYHLSSHLGDEFLIKNPQQVRINYSRDAFVWGHSYYLNDDLRIYGEAGWASYVDGGSEPWEFQFGIDYSPVQPLVRHGAPFFAINGHLRQEVDFGGNLVVQGGWQWRGTRSSHLLRAGLQYYNGKSSQYEFFNRTDHYGAFGVWYDY